MLKNITLSAEEALIQKARQKAMNEKKTLNAVFRDWLKSYMGQGKRKINLDEFLQRFSHIDSGGKKFTREEMNERR